MRLHNKRYSLTAGTANPSEAMQSDPVALATLTRWHCSKNSLKQRSSSHELRPKLAEVTPHVGTSSKDVKKSHERTFLFCLILFTKNREGSNERNYTTTTFQIVEIVTFAQTFLKSSPKKKEKKNGKHGCMQKRSSRSRCKHEQVVVRITVLQGAADNTGASLQRSGLWH